MHILRLCQAREVGAQDIQFIKLEFIEFPPNSFGDVMSRLCLSCAAGCVWGLCVQQGINAVVWVCCSYLEKHKNMKEMPKHSPLGRGQAQ